MDEMEMAACVRVSFNVQRIWKVHKGVNRIRGGLHKVDTMVMSRVNVVENVKSRTHVSRGRFAVVG